MDKDKIIKELDRIIDGIIKYADDTVWCGDAETVVDALLSLQADVRDAS